MAVAQSRRGQGKFEVLIKTQELAMYTVRICSNPKTFDPINTDQYYKNLWKET